MGKLGGKMRRRWEYIIKMVRKEIGRKGVECVHLAGDKKKLGCCEQGNEP